ncbi:hypothetical protein GN244_ATG06474 [Phytophthora infestans]|uniref:Uncharacterized protein n=1 Tax=Phytophthora infestans TaxID=4787 RepID=A0A833SV82_PHYIN|nr:hypothetical protein GN244_ATG06474 [Phytophthora infestans]KAF4149703.1 hypothetical protein GN958_ATG01099 [Phytophthora infestans]
MGEGGRVLERDEPHKRRRLDLLLNGAFSVPKYYRKMPMRPLKASKCWKFDNNAAVLSSVKAQALSMRPRRREGKLSLEGDIRVRNERLQHCAGVFRFVVKVWTGKEA